MTVAARRQRWMCGGSVGRAAEAVQQRCGNSGQFGGGVGSARAVEAVQWRRWMRSRAAGRQSGISNSSRGVSAVAAQHWQQHGGRGGGGGSPITPAMALPIPLLIAAARLGNVAVSHCGLRGSGGLLGGLSSLNVFYHILIWSWGRRSMAVAGEVTRHGRARPYSWSITIHSLRSKESEE